MMLCPSAVAVFAVLLGLAASTAAGENARAASAPPSPQQVLSTAVAAWHFAGAESADGRSPLRAEGDVRLGVDLDAADRAASLARGGDGKVAVFDGGWLDAGQGGDGRLNLEGNALTLLVRLQNPSGQWRAGELFAKHGGHDKLVYNLFANSGRLGFEYGTDGTTGLAGQVTLEPSSFDPRQWHDLVVRCDGKNLTLFLDGLSIGRARVSGGRLRQGNTQPVVIARRGFSVLLDHVALWSRALSDAEVVAVSGGEAAIAGRREALARRLEAKLGREGLTLADQLRGARELRQRLWADPHRPRYHLLPPDGFWNDINGTIYWKGRYHVFFLGRLAPDIPTILSGADSDHPRETWLHASSRDLVHWIHHPPALTPVFDGSMPRGLYSGDMMDGMAVPTIIVHVPGQGTCLYTAEDDELIRWKPHPKNPVIPAQGAPPEAVIFDPCGWKDGPWHYALVGNKNHTPGYEGDSTSLFRSRDLATWEYRGPFYKSQRRWTAEYMDCACPDFFPLADKHVLISHVHRPSNHLQYYVGRLDTQAMRFLPEGHGFMSWPGGSVCAPETLLDGKGRRIFWGWIMEARGNANGWGSVATLPRVLSIGAGATLGIEPAPELEALRSNERTHAELALEGERPLTDVRGDCLELEAVFEPQGATEFGLIVRRSPGGEEQTAIVCTPAAGTLKVELARSTLDPTVKYRWGRPEAGAAEPPPIKEQVAPFALATGEPLRLRVFIDRSVLEVYANGRQCITQRIYPSRADSLGVALVSRGGKTRVASLRAWDLSPTNSW